MANRPPRRPFHIGAAIVRLAVETTRAKCACVGYVLPAICAEHVIPQWGANAVASVIVVVMMTHMVLL